MTQQHEYEAKVLDVLKRAVAEALERKRKLGQYAVIWREGRVVCTKLYRARCARRAGSPVNREPVIARRALSASRTPRSTVVFGLPRGARSLLAHALKRAAQRVADCDVTVT